jgi:hypothetical protein
VVDWQTSGHGFAMWDLGYLIGGSFEPAVRADVERDLLADYLDCMAAAGISYDADTCWHDYRLGAVWGVVLSVIATIVAAETDRGNDLLTLMTARHGRQVLDLESMALLD